MSEMTAAEWRVLAADAHDLAISDARNAAFHAESARLFEREAETQEAAA